MSFTATGAGPKPMMHGTPAATPPSTRQMGARPFFSRRRRKQESNPPRQSFTPEKLPAVHNRRFTLHCATETAVISRASLPLVCAAVALACDKTRRRPGPRVTPRNPPGSPTSASSFCAVKPTSAPILPRVSDQAQRTGECRYDSCEASCSEGASHTLLAADLKNGGSFLDVSTGAQQAAP